MEEIKDALTKNTKQRIIKNPIISKIDENEVRISVRFDKTKLIKLHKLIIIGFQLDAILRHAREEEVSINIDNQAGTITLKGLSAKISVCESRIMDVIKDAVERNGKLEEAKSIAQQVQNCNIFEME